MHFESRRIPTLTHFHHIKNIRFYKHVAAHSRPVIDIKRILSDIVDFVCMHCTLHNIQCCKILGRCANIEILKMLILQHVVHCYCVLLCRFWVSSSHQVFAATGRAVYRSTHTIFLYIFDDCISFISSKRITGTAAGPRNNSKFSQHILVCTRSVDSTHSTLVDYGYNMLNIGKITG